VTAARLRGVYRGYWTGRARAGQVRRVHIIREDGPKGWEPGKQTLCGQHAWPVTNSEPVILDPLPATPPPGLTWCPKCVGHAAELAGLLDDLAARLAAWDPTATQATRAGGADA
jgi:hypothetical protein